MENRKLPNATAVLVLGIISIPGCCFYCIGLVFGIIALVLAKKDAALYHLSPESYDNYSNVKTGKTLAIIGIVLNVLALVLMIVAIALFGFAALQNPELMQEKINEMQQ